MSEQASKQWMSGCVGRAGGRVAEAGQPEPVEATASPTMMLMNTMP
jgi:hypothetical protein